MKQWYIAIFIISLVVLTTLTILALIKLTTFTEDYATVALWFNWLSAGITFLNFSFTTILLVLAHFIIYRKRIDGKLIYLVLGLPYLLFMVFSVINYIYVYELYNVFQVKSLKPVDTPDMENIGLNIAFLTMMVGAINLGIVWAVKSSEPD